MDICFVELEKLENSYDCTLRTMEFETIYAELFIRNDEFRFVIEDDAIIHYHDIGIIDMVSDLLSKVCEKLNSDDIFTDSFILIVN